MSYISSLFASFVALTLSASTPVNAPAKPPQEWILLGTSQEATHEVSRSSINWVQEPLAVEFIFRTKFIIPKNVKGHMLREMRERTLILCNEGILITMDQNQIETNGKSTKFERSVVYVNPEVEDSVVTATIEWACGVTPEYMKPKVQPKQPTRAAIRV